MTVSVPMLWLMCTVLVSVAVIEVMPLAVVLTHTVAMVMSVSVVMVPMTVSVTTVCFDRGAKGGQSE